MTVDMIATGTDIKPVEIIMFMRAVKSRNYFEQIRAVESGSLATLISSR